MRTHKALGLALLAVFAMAAVMASAAQATTEKPSLTTTAGEGSVFLSAETDVENILTVSTGNLKCTTVSIPATTTVKLPAETIEVHPEYSGCKAYGVSMTATTTGCNFLFHTTNNGAGAATTDIKCEAGKAITLTPVAKEGIEAITCTVTIGAQNGLEGATFDSIKNALEPPKDDLTMTITVNGIAYVETGAECSAPGAHVDGVYKGSITIKGFKDTEGTKGGQVGILVD